MNDDETGATRQETATAMVHAARRRGAVPVRREFVQTGSQHAPQAGPLSGLVRARDELGLDLYLLHRARASAEPWDVAVPASVWARAVGAEDPARVSKAWRRLADLHQLVERDRKGRTARITALREDGSADPYTSPTGKSWGERYFKIPFAYWTDEQDWSAELTLAGKATLLIALSLPATFVLPIERGPAWYGISADTLNRGFDELVKKGALSRTKRVKSAPLAPTGKSVYNEYTRLGAFAAPHRRPAPDPAEEVPATEVNVFDEVNVVDPEILATDVPPSEPVLTAVKSSAFAAPGAA